MIHKILEEIAKESSTTAKRKILEKYKGDQVLQKVLYLAESPRIKFYIKQIPTYTSIGDPGYGLNTALAALENIYTRKITGDQAKKTLFNMLSFLSKKDADVIKRVVLKKLNINMGATEINKVIPGLIEETPYMGAVPFNEKKAQAIFEGGKKAYSQVKMDGRYANSQIFGGIAEMESRGGEITYIGDAHCIKEMKKFPDCVLNGELTMPGFSRYESNGIIASLVSIGGKKAKGEDITKEIAKFDDEHRISYIQALKEVVYTCWDIISHEEYADCSSKTPYSERLELLEDIIESKHLSNIKVIEYEIVDCYEDAIEHFQKMLKRGEEGTILKSMDGEWRDGKPSWQVKMKLEITVDLKITGFQQGTGKNSHVISTLFAESFCGLLKTKPTGMKEKTMEFVTNNQSKLLGTVVEVECSGLSHDSEGNYSLLHPRIIRLRDDKMTGDTLESIKKIEKAAKTLKKTKKETV